MIARLAIPLIKGLGKLLAQSAAASLLLFWLSSVLAAQPENSSHSDASVVGYVFKMTGEWLQDGSPLKQGERVFAGARITVSPDALAQDPSDAEIIVHLASGQREERSAKNPGSLSEPIELELLKTPDSGFAKVVNAVQSLFVKQPERYIPVMTRGQRSQTLQEAVVTFQNGTTNLTSLFESVPQGKYLVRLRALSVEGASATSLSNKANVDWNPSAKSGAKISLAAPGLYRVSILDLEERPLGSAWVLLCKPEGFQAAEKAFGEALELTKKWGAGVSDEERHALLRAYLEYLANNTRSAQ